MNPRDINPSDFKKLEKYEERIRFLLRYAVLAPSTHNTQPWLFKIQGNRCEIFYDERYLLPEADPKRRDLFISMGCLLENLAIAANYFNVIFDLKIDVDSQTTQVATFTIEGLSSTNFNDSYEKLLFTIPTRINARGLYTSLEGDLDLVEAARLNLPQEYTNGININLISEKSKIEKVASLTAKGLELAYNQPRFRKEVSKWMKNSLTRKKEGLPGYSLKMPFLFSFILPTLVRYKDIGKFLGKLNSKSLASAPVVTIISSKLSEPLTWVNVGRIAQRMMLDINSQGLNTSIFIAAIEMGDLYKELKNITGINDDPQFLFVVGRVDSLPRFTPRHNIDKKII